MTVKDIIGRKRYVVFYSFISNNLLLFNIKNNNYPIFIRVISFKNNILIIRCKHTDTKKLIEIIKDLDPVSKSILTSGTLKSLNNSLKEKKII